MRDVKGADGSGGAGGKDGKANRRMTRGDSTHGDITSSTAVERDIAFLLADAAGEVEIGIAPYQAVVRGGRRRKARRWAVAAAAAVVIAGTTGTLAVTVVPDGGGDRVTPAATPEVRRMDEPWRTTLAEGRDQGTVWRVEIDAWEPSRDKAEAARQFAAMGLFGDVPTGVDGSADLVGKSWHFVRLLVDEGQAGAMIDGEADALSGTDLEVSAMVLRTGDWDKDGAPKRLVIGQVAPTAREVRVTWSDDTFVDVKRNRDDGWHADLRNPRIVDVKGAPASWFVALAPEGVGYESAKVTK
ncbi:hypothetical protein [Streptomyces europaeiscabiei]|uniref:Uncharacterized protein n=2 Tax=Streptomyces europaeiscabiei TaxID=146819 RepID=A0ABU4ND67_9ACTN|nr:hypothetical protein [Streptomyces europaeiscabiei]MDX3545348.1 hypothetical protein [Streptomyces europaeiscabiei]MDX3554339.1 hypothetical protein [Streptomyces europaeiscabiei]MDX3699410.1 hypothetical protein [Streptomyces europaeiscabiei]MDX3779494.1 hypothetical protein [Streptomyces europaeiscabiei]MDX3840755.1 hypothetical protein [Streptomyces europaeiscabiei]